MDKMRYRKCPGCGKHKSIDDFRDEDTETGRFYKFCLECGGSVVPKWPDEKECPICENIRPLKDFKRTPGRGRSANICNFCNEEIEAEKKKKRKELEKKRAEKKAALEKWEKIKKPVHVQRKSNMGQSCPVCGVFKTFAKYRRQGVAEVTEDTACNRCIGTEGYAAWHSERLREYNRKKQREYRKNKKTS